MTSDYTTSSTSLPLGDEPASGDVGGARCPNAAVKLDALARLLQNTDQGLVVAKPDSRILTCTPTALSLHGYDPQGAIPSCCEEFTSPLDLQSLDGEPLPQRDWPLTRALRGDSFNHLSLRVRHRGTDASRLLSYGSWPIWNGDGQIEMALVTVQDLSHLMDAELALRESESRYYALFWYAAVGVAQVAQDGRLLDVNPRMCELLAERRKALIGSSLFAYIHHEDQPMESPQLEMLWNGQLPSYTLEQRYVRRDGGSFWARVTSSIAMDPSLPPFRIVIVRDITEARQAAETLRLSEELLQRQYEQLQADEEELRVQNEELQAAEEELRLQNEELLRVRHHGEAEHERYRRLFELAPDGYLVSDGYGIILEANRAAASLFRVDTRRMLGMPLQDFVSAADLDHFRSHLAQATASGTPLRFEARFRPSDGESFDADIRAVGENDADARRAVVRWMVRDISYRKRMEGALRDSEHRFRLAIDHFPGVLVIYDSRRRIRYINSTGTQIFGIPEHEVIGRRDEDLFSAERTARYLPSLLEAFRTGSAQVVEFTENAEHSGRTWRVQYVPLTVEGQGVTQVLGVLTDITERIASQRELERQKRSFERLAENAPDVITRVDTEGRYLFVSPAISQWGPIPREAYIGQKNEELGLPESFVAARQAALERVLRTRDSAQLPFELLSEEGVQYYASTLVPEFGADGEVESVLTISHNVTSLKLSEQALRESEERLRQANESLEERVAERTAEANYRALQLRRLAGQLTEAEQRERRNLAKLLHDHLQQLLVAAKLNTRLAQDRLDRAGSDQAASAALAQVSSLLDESIQSSRSLTVELSPPVLYELGLVAALEWLARSMFEKHQLSVAVHADRWKPLESESVRVLLFEILRELLFNVVKHSGVREAHVRLDRLPQSLLQLTVEDQGVGFDPSVALGGDDSLSGFGLFSIQERLGLLDGWLEVDSAPGQGARLTVYLPMSPLSEREESDTRARSVVSGQSQARPAQAAPDDGVGAIRVLLADDHRVVRKGLAGLLEEEPDIVVVGEADDGEAAVELALQLHPDVIVMDVTMPRLNGVEATRRIVSQQPTVSVIGLSMHEQADLAAAMLKAGAQAYLSKSGPADELIDAIRAHAPRRA